MTKPTTTKPTTTEPNIMTEFTTTSSSIITPSVSESDISAAKQRQKQLISKVIRVLIDFQHDIDSLQQQFQSLNNEINSK
ncbi:hypothetical protein [Laspinema olomoucense]|uniref:hypothetical protein n=1 Tax=Laspinema olomoucense TaxID=3231600 RepID=UPI0021BB2503|nr:hypothetical protein [Laspinema sp. D3c]MCT7992398.1 hypothetical protein [Laspinema sp. D3c]